MNLGGRKGKMCLPNDCNIMNANKQKDPTGRRNISDEIVNNWFHFKPSQLNI